VTWFDVGALVIVGLVVLDGAYSGLLWALLELVLLVGAALLAGSLSAHAEPVISKIADLEQPALAWASYVTVFGLVGAVLLGALFLLHSNSKRWRFKHDSWYGGALAVVTGVLAACLLFSSLIWCSPRSYDDSLRRTPLLSTVRALHDTGLTGLLPPDVGLRLQQLGDG
jgi:colicin V production protein